MKLRDHLKEVRRLEEKHARQVQRLQDVSAKRLFQYLSDDTIDRITDDLIRVQDPGALPLIHVMGEFWAKREDQQS
jgi:hypothetical protein